MEPQNRLTQSGYRLVFGDEFDAGNLDTTKWLPVYLPQWSSTERSAARTSLRLRNQVSRSIISVVLP
ncbi:MAG TPA: hypothetical protein VIT91_16550 [Chthoniobacterales bacterium]